MEDVVARDRIIDVATRLFAALGYDGTNLRLIADAVGMNPSQITELAGGKRELYLEMMRRSFEAELTALREVVESAESGRAALHRILDVYLDYHVENPEIGAVWMHRWVSDALDISDLEDRYPRPLLQMCANKIRPALPEGVDPYYVLATMVWCVLGFVGSGVLARDHGMTQAAEPTALDSFRAHMHLLMDRLLAPDGPAAPPAAEGNGGQPRM